ncbi:MAG: hypothetical protein KatS3mg031_0462 [Chitinophagales bacterium]|nr:MAG: hypothetical protein KatS3mg031_0462 [Chitinophagales bacterium]
MKLTVIPLFLLLLVLVVMPQPCEAQRKAKYNGMEEDVGGKELRILSWNIQMLPRFLVKISRGPMRRARLIPSKVVDDQIDIIVFQEVFDGRARRMLKKRLKDHYPHIVGPANRKPGSLKGNSGVMMFSKIPLKHLGEIRFKDCEGEDCYARKGALLAEGAWEGKVFQLLGTHLEAGGPDSIKRNQYREIRQLLDRHKKKNVPQVLCGDFNTDKDLKSDLYNDMLFTLEALDGDLEGELTYTSDELLNDMNLPAPGHKPKRKVIDYVLIRENGYKPKSVKRHVRQYQHRWSKKYKDLSDHNAVLMRVEF